VVAAVALRPEVGRAERAWTELTSAHFVVRTDLPPAEARELVQTLEDARAAMLAMVWGGQAGPPTRLTVVALASATETRRLTRGVFSGVYVRADHFPPTIVFGGRPLEVWLVKHELAHHLSSWFLPAAPRWYEEGFSTFLETIRYDRAARRAYLGEPALERHATLQATGPLPKDELFGQPSLERYERFEASSWALVHLLVNTRAAAFERFQRRLGAFERLNDAWAAEFPDLDAKRLAAALRDYPAVGLRSVSPHSLPPWQGRIASRALPPAEVHAVRAYLAAFVTDDGVTNAQRARGPIGDALAADPTLVEALAMRFYLLGPVTGAEATSLADRARKAHPDSWLAWLMTADAETERAAARTALARALALAPNQPEVIRRLSALDAIENRWPEALALSSRMIAVRAVSDESLMFHMATLAFAGRCDESAAWNAALSSYLPAEKASRAISARQRLGWACRLSGRPLRACAGAAPGAAAPVFEGGEGPPAMLAYWRRLLDFAVKPENNWYPADVWRLIDPDGWLYGGGLMTTLLVTADDKGQVKDTCLERASGVDLLDRTTFGAFANARMLPVPPGEVLKGKRVFRLRLPLGFRM
jgi:hypothetical protein